MIKNIDFSKTTVAVIGDVMLDSYWHGSTNRISPEAPVPVVKVDVKDKRPGGAANVALNIAAIGCKVKLFGLCGQDEAGKELESLLNQQGIEPRLWFESGCETITKLRILSQSQQLIRMDFEDSLWQLDKTELYSSFEKGLADVDMVVVSDYAKGTLSDVPHLVQLCQQHQIPVLIDPKGEDFDKYAHASMLTPNKKEFELIMGACPTEEILYAKGMEMLRRYQLEHLLVTQGADGMTLFRKDLPPFHLSTDAKAVYDVTGAGDTVIGVLSACLAAGLGAEPALEKANKAAGIVVGKVGAETVTWDELNDNNSRQLLSFENFQSIITQDALRKLSYEIYLLQGEKMDVAMLLPIIQAHQAGKKVYLLIKNSLSNLLIENVLLITKTIKCLAGVVLVSSQQIGMFSESFTVLESEHS